METPSVSQWTLRHRNPVKPKEVTERAHDHVLPDLVIGSRVVRPGPERCGAVYLPLGDCREPVANDSSFCYYHDKLQRELTEPTADTYPVWPMPRHGYVVNRPSLVKE